MMRKTVFYLARINKIWKLALQLQKIFKIAIEENACSIILAHNHPSGNIAPSDADKSLTKKIKESGFIIDIPVVDHIIVSNNDYYSFADEGTL